jgi:hypothetical protein
MKSFEEFWPFYVGEHSKPITRLLHFAGSTISLLMVVAGVLTMRWSLLPVALVQGYAWAWVGHFGFEHNRPATFKYPLWSFRGDWKMWALMLTGKMGAEVKRLGVEARA